MFRAFVSLVLVALPTLALPTLAVAESAPGRLLAALSADWNADGILDAATLVQAADGMADLVVYLGTGVTGLEPVVAVASVVFAGPMAGQLPTLSARTDTSFAINSEQTGIGRTPWFQSITVALRGGEFLVAGYSYSFYDRLDLAHFGSCDVNLLTGDFSVTQGPGDGTASDTGSDGATEAPGIVTEGRAARGAFALADLTEGYVAPACDHLFR